VDAIPAARESELEASAVKGEVIDPTSDGTIAREAPAEAEATQDQNQNVSSSLVDAIPAMRDSALDNDEFLNFDDFRNFKEV